MKTLFRFVFATFLATTVYYYSNGSESNQQVLVQTEMAPNDYKIVGTNHPNSGLEVDANQIAEFCKGGDLICAEPRSGSGLPEVNWTGSMLKF